MQKTLNVLPTVATVPGAVQLLTRSSEAKELPLRSPGRLVRLLQSHQLPYIRMYMYLPGFTFFYYYYLFSLFLTFLRRKRATVGTKEKCIHMPTHNLNSLRKPSCVVLNKFSWILGFPIMLGATWGSFTHHWIVTLKIQVETLSFLGLIIWKTSEDLQGGECCGWLWSAGGGVFFWM